MKATVITTGPGVIIATATALTNWRFGQPMMLENDSAMQERNDCESAPEDKQPNLCEEGK
jgi:hypothetical protein